MMEIKAVGYQSDDLLAIAQDIAEKLSLTIEKDSSACLFVSAEHLSLKQPNFSSIYADFSYATWEKRKSEGKKQGLVRACKPCAGLQIIDATAGWGKDAAILASFGAKVLMLERNKIMASLLEDALSRLSESDKSAMDLSLHFGGAAEYLSSITEEKNYPDVIYIDPMHPERRKSALVKKEMQILQNMIGPDLDVLELIQIARTKVKQRVVVKWPQKGNETLKPDASIGGKTVRFDIYLPRSQ